MTQLLKIEPVKLKNITCSICKEKIKHPLSKIIPNPRVSKFISSFSGNIEDFLTLEQRDVVTHKVCEECLLLLRG